MLGKKLGLTDKGIEEVAKRLAALLADLHGLYVKTLGFHWNIEDPRFYSLHKLLEKQYEALSEDSDAVAERMRKLGKRAPGSLKELKHLLRLRENEKPLSGDEMLKELLENYEQLIRDLRKDIDKASKVNDFGTADMLTQMLRSFESRAWMLRSHT